MKLIDLLNMKAMGIEMPKKIKYEEDIFRFDKVFKDYFDIDNGDFILKRINLNRLNDEVEILEDILDEKEEEYIIAVIRPFKDKVTYISKIGNRAEKEEFIQIQVANWNKNPIPEYINLPFFKKNTMYKGMEIGKTYTLEELGL